VGTLALAPGLAGVGAAVNRTGGDRAMDAQRDRALAALAADLPPGPVLDLGCGRGEVLGRIGLGRRGVGVDPAGERLRAAPLPVAVADGAALPFPDDTFVAVTLVNVVSSVPDQGHRERLAAEVRRVLVTGGTVLWYDQRWPNPANRATRAVTRRRVARLFPDATMELRSLTVVPALARLAPGAYSGLHRLAGLRTHLVGCVRPR